MLEFNPDLPVWQDIAIDGLATLADFHEVIYEFDPGDGWEHHIELEVVREASPNREPEVVAAQGEAPPQYPDPDE